MLEHPIITMTTDFGLKDPFVGIMKGVIFSINPNAVVVDLSHNISPQNIAEASYVIDIGHRHFPPTTIHICVVDPDVGSQRRPILVVTDDHYFIGPDNGVFSHIYNRSYSIFKVIHLTAEHFFLPDRGKTFHGRDIFAPAAGWLSKGIESRKFGDEITDYISLQSPIPRKITKSVIEGQIIYIDNFGNAVTNISKATIDSIQAEKPQGRVKVIFKGQQIYLSNFYAEGREGFSALIDSYGNIELFVYRGNAARDFDIKVGETIGVIVD